MEKPWYKSYVKGVAYTLQYEKITMPQALTRSVNQFPDKTALIFIDSRISYKQLDDRVNRFANALIDLGVKPGDKVAMLMPNMPQLVAATYGAWRAGAVVIMNNPLYTDKELEYQFNNSESSFLITLDLLGPRMIALKPKTPIKHIVVAHIRDHLRFPKKQLLPIEVIKEFESKTGSQICEGYGLSETSPVATTNPFGGVTKVGSVGLPVPDTDIKIVDLIDGQKEMPVGESGEIIIKGPQVTSGYYKMPEETAIAIRDGWLYTGDIGGNDDSCAFIYVAMYK
ncbi:MAG: AMP-binding protein [Deltaproteobacteria bacterium]|nr:AMP-binding protein [Deltaproteobacteria bacterium]